MTSRRPLAALVAAGLLGACAQAPSAPESAEEVPAPRTIFVKPSGGPRMEAARRHRDLAKAARSAGDLATARDHLAVVVLVEPDDASARQELDALTAEIRKRVNDHLEDARAAQRAGDAGRASAEYLRVLALEPRQAEATRALKEIDRQNMARAQSSRASRVRVEDLFADARAARAAPPAKGGAAATASTEPRDASYDLEARLELLRSSDPSVALRELKVWVDANPRDRASRQKIGAAVAERAKEAEGRGQNALAFSLYEQAVVLRGEPQREWSASAATLRKQVGEERYGEGVRLMRTDIDGAVRALEAAVQADPKNALAAAKLREAQAAQQRFKKMPAK